MVASGDSKRIRPSVQFTIRPPGEELNEAATASAGSAWDDLANRPIELAAPRGKTPGQLQQELNPLDETLGPEDLPRFVKPEAQFNLREVLLMMTCAAMGLAGARWFPGGLFPVLVQSLGILMLIVISILGVSGRRVTLASWSFLVMFAAAVFQTIWQISQTAP